MRLRLSTLQGAVLCLYVIVSKFIYFIHSQRLLQVDFCFLSPLFYFIFTDKILIGFLVVRTVVFRRESERWQVKMLTVIITHTVHVAPSLINFNFNPSIYIESWTINNSHEDLITSAQHLYQKSVHDNSKSEKAIRRNYHS